MQVWVICVFVFFGAAELYHWMQNIALPLPVYGVAGLLLAIASNAKYWQPVSSNRSSHSDARLHTSNLAMAEQPTALPLTAPPSAALPSTVRQPQLPDLISPQTNISFTIAKPK